jgi:RimJ/RimL family protein N-acetyltransferase
VVTKKAPEEFLTARLLLRRPKGSDVKSIFNRYASDPDVARYLGWPRHQSLKQTRNFIEYSNDQWDRWPAGPYLVLLRENNLLIGGTGFSLKPYTEPKPVICLQKMRGEKVMPPKV